MERASFYVRLLRDSRPRPAGLTTISFLAPAARVKAVASVTSELSSSKPESTAAAPSRSSRWPSTLALLVFAVGVALRLALAVANSDANDDHTPVIRAIAYEARIPGREDTWEGFHPKLYHATVAPVWKMLPTDDPSLLGRAAQLISCLAGVLTLAVVWRFLHRITLSDRTRFLGFALVSLNPSLIGINAQATNDSFVILFATLALYHGYWFFASWERPALGWMTLFAILAGISKGNGLVVLLAMLSTFVFYGLVNLNKGAILTHRLIPALFAFLVPSVLAVSLLGSYATNYVEYGSAFVINIEKDPPPALFEKTYPNRPGITSIVDSYFTFHFFDLLRNPGVGTSQTTYPLNRTSLWSQLYARTLYVHFEGAPPTWAPRHGFLRFLARAIFVLGLVPGAFLLVGLARGLWRLVVALKKRDPADLGDRLLLLTALGSLAFLVAYTLQYRDYATMKAIFVFPGLLAFVTLFAGECERFFAGAGTRPWLTRGVTAAFCGLFGLWTVDAATLIYQVL